VIIPYSVLPAQEGMSPAGTPSSSAGARGTPPPCSRTASSADRGPRRLGTAVASALVFHPDPSALTFSDGGALRRARADHAAVTLCDGTVLLVGGADAAGAVVAAEVYNRRTEPTP